MEISDNFTYAMIEKFKAQKMGQILHMKKIPFFLQIQLQLLSQVTNQAKQILALLKHLCT